VNSLGDCHIRVKQNMLLMVSFIVLYFPSYHIEGNDFKVTSFMNIVDCKDSLQ